MEASQWAEIRRLYYVEKMSKSAIAERLVKDRSTIKRAIELEVWGKNKKIKRRSKLSPYKAKIEELLRKEPCATSVRITEEIKKLGYDGGITIVKDYLRKVRGRRNKAWLRVETLPGEEAQMDWGYYGLMDFYGTKRKVYFFVMTLSFSRMMYVEFTVSMAIGSFLSCHINAFRYFGGVPKKCLYDNVKTVVIRRYFNHAQYNSRFLDFCGYYLFEPVLCKIKSPWEKGKCESGVKFVKRNFLSLREFENFSDLLKKTDKWLRETANVRVHGTTGERPVERFLREKEYLVPLRERDYETRTPVRVKGHYDLRVRFENNFYSFPCAYTGLDLDLFSDKWGIEICHEGKRIARHQRCYGKGQVIEDPRHIEEVARIKKRARFPKQKDCFLSLDPCCEKYLLGLMEKELDIRKEIEGIMGMVGLYGKTGVVPAIQKANEHNAYGLIYLKHIIEEQRNAEKKGELRPLNLKRFPELDDVSVPPGDLRDYDRLFGEDEI